MVKCFQSCLVQICCYIIYIHVGKHYDMHCVLYYKDHFSWYTTVYHLECSFNGSSLVILAYLEHEVLKVSCFDQPQQ